MNPNTVSERLDINWNIVWLYESAAYFAFSTSDTGQTELSNKASALAESLPARTGELSVELTGNQWKLMLSSYVPDFEKVPDFADQWLGDALKSLTTYEHEELVQEAKRILPTLNPFAIIEAHFARLGRTPEGVGEEKVCIVL